MVLRAEIGVAAVLCGMIAAGGVGRAAAESPPAWTKVASWPLTNVAVSSLVPPNGFPGAPNTSLLLTTFGFGSGDGVWGIRNLANAARNPTSADLVSLDKTIHWPNMAALAPSPLGASGWGAGRSLVLEVGGFFPNPLKATGQIMLTDVTDFASPVSYLVSHPKSNFFYHEAQWVDVNGDGRLDIVAARTEGPGIPIVKPAVGELIWLEQPVMTPSGPFNASWVERVIISPHGPDVSFIVHDFDGDGSVEVLASEFFVSQSLTLHWCPVPWDRCDPNQVQSRDVAGIDKPFFSVSLADLNGDGRLDVLTTTNLADGTGQPYGVEVPTTDVTKAPWTVHPLGPPGYTPQHKLLPGQGGPGTALAFSLNTKAPGPKPFVLLSGDDNGTVCVLTPNSDSPNDWLYTETRLFTSPKGTVGSLAVGDVDGDGWAEVVVPSYAESMVDLYTFKPPSAEDRAAQSHPQH